MMRRLSDRVDSREENEGMIQSLWPWMDFVSKKKAIEISDAQPAIGWEPF
jgi:hypothetical protein